MNEVDLKLKKGIVKGVMKVETFTKIMKETLDLQRAVEESLEIIDNGGYAEQTIKEVIYAETDWLMMFLRLQQLGDEEIYFGVIEAEYKGLPQLKIGKKSSDNKRFKVPVQLLNKNQDFLVLNSLTREGTDHVGRFFKNRFANFLEEKEWEDL